MARLLQAAQDEGLLQHVHVRPSCWELAGPALQQLGDHAQAVHDAGDAIAAMLPSAKLICARMHIYASTEPA